MAKKKKKATKKVIVGKAYFDLLTRKADMIDRIFSIDGAADIRPGDFKESAKFIREGDKLDLVEEGPREYFPPKGEV